MNHVSALRPGADPFDERSKPAHRRTVRMLGGTFEFLCEDRRLLRLVDAAYADLPTDRQAGARPRFRIRLRCVESRDDIATPPPLLLSSGAGTLCGMMDAANFSIVAPAQRAALVSVSSSMLAHPYHARYELLEFATYTLAARSQRLVSMHAACVGLNGRGAILIGPSGAGKSTLALYCVSQGLRLLSEDSVFVSPQALAAHGIGAFLHLRTGSACRPRDARLDAIYSAATIIRRRSGIEKHALDLRRSPELISPAPLHIGAFVFLSRGRRSDRTLLRRIAPAELRERLEASQAYAAAQAGWESFWRRAKRVPAFVLGRARDPESAASRIASLIN